MQNAARANTPAHLWIVAILGMVWNGFVAFDFVMTVTGNHAYLARYEPDVRDYFAHLPNWFVAFWALGVWGGLAGSLLLLVRSKHAVKMFALALVGPFVNTLYQLILSPPPADLTSNTMLLMMLLVWAIAIALFLYARDMQRQRILGELN